MTQGWLACWLVSHRLRPDPAFFLVSCQLVLLSHPLAGMWLGQKTLPRSQGWNYGGDRERLTLLFESTRGGVHCPPLTSALGKQWPQKANILKVNV